ncbi:hypothetical protein HNQ94_003474 [Salirhabdus euzebyi]|uniref:Uncharacterized protein n=1 Tax=Salirhabdus euzebyi TaxID=394506 RepID=A0A841Q9A0_9BACI|nr:hypothetical protein [Salirhabdus euzebyi]MBB6454980.1 hypothetical protein [Salirhabdus euzebyi]
MGKKGKVISFFAVGLSSLALWKKFGNNKKEYKEDVKSTFEKAGKPELSHQENADMVAEGSQFGVQYYNKKKSHQVG